MNSSKSRSATALGWSAALMMLGATPEAARADWIVGAGAGLRFDDNVGNAQPASDVVGDSILNASLSMFQLFPLNEGYSVTIGGDLAGERYQAITGLSNASLDGTVALKRKWGLGAFAPWARAEVSLGRSDYDDSYRNAWVYRAALASGRRIDERWNFWIEYTFERRAAAAQQELVPGYSGNAYSQSSHNVDANLEYSLNEKTFLGLALLGRHGDVVSTTEESAKIYTASQALAADPAFGSEEYAYRLTGTTFGYRVGIHCTPTERSLLGFGFTRWETHADGGNNYSKSVPEITWAYSF